jgi:hypothetical protein
MLSCFVLDPGGSREIGLCPHLRIYPTTVRNNMSRQSLWILGLSHNSIL